jgi:hypothetical protein
MQPPKGPLQISLQPSLLSSDIRTWDSCNYIRPCSTMLRLSRLQGIISSLPRTWHTQEISETKNAGPAQARYQCCLHCSKASPFAWSVHNSWNHWTCSVNLGRNPLPETSQRHWCLSVEGQQQWVVVFGEHITYGIYSTGVHQLCKISNWQWCTSGLVGTFTKYSILDNVYVKL